jgi:hypothetical protein
MTGGRLSTSSAEVSLARVEAIGVHGWMAPWALTPDPAGVSKSEGMAVTAGLVLDISYRFP